MESHQDLELRNLKCKLSACLFDVYCHYLSGAEGPDPGPVSSPRMGRVGKRFNCKDKVDQHGSKNPGARADAERRDDLGAQPLAWARGKAGRGRTCLGPMRDSLRPCFHSSTRRPTRPPTSAPLALPEPGPRASTLDLANSADKLGQ